MIPVVSFDDLLEHEEKIFVIKVRYNDITAVESHFFESLKAVFLNLGGCDLWVDQWEQMKA